MRKSKLFLFISILTIIFLFGTAALIDRCSIFSGPEADKEDVKKAEEDINIWIEQLDNLINYLNIKKEYENNIGYQNTFKNSFQDLKLIKRT